MFITSRRNTSVPRPAARQPTRDAGAGSSPRERTRHERTRSTDGWVRACPLAKLGERTGRCAWTSASARYAWSAATGSVRAPRRVHPSGRPAVRRRGGRRRHRMLAARLPLRPCIRPGTLAAGHPAGGRLSCSNRGGRRIREHGYLHPDKRSVRQVAVPVTCRYPGKAHCSSLMINFGSPQGRLPRRRAGRATARWPRQNHPSPGFFPWEL